MQRRTARRVSGQSILQYPAELFWPDSSRLTPLYQRFRTTAFDSMEDCHERE